MDMFISFSNTYPKKSKIHKGKVSEVYRNEILLHSILLRVQRDFLKIQYGRFFIEIKFNLTHKESFFADILLSPKKSPWYQYKTYFIFIISAYSLFYFHSRRYNL